MEENSMYDKLLLLPLFQGLCKEDFTNILEKVKLHFQKYPTGHYIARQDDACNSLAFVLQGKVLSESTDKTHHYTLYETLDAPHVIEPYSLWTPRMSSSLIRYSACIRNTTLPIPL